MTFNVKDKIIKENKELAERIAAHKVLGHKIVCTIGSWDMLHIGHVRYLNKAKEHGDVLVVGVDSDEAIRLYKGPLRPIIPENERMEMLCYQECIDYVILIHDVDKKGDWKFGLVREIPVDVFVAVSDESYTSEQKATIDKYCGRLEILPRQAEKTSSTDIVQNVLKIHLAEDVKKLRSEE